ELFLPPQELLGVLGRFPRLVLSAEEGRRISLGATPPPEVERNVSRLHDVLREGAARGFETVVLCDNEGQLQRLEELLSEGRRVLPPRTTLGIGSLGGGFELSCASPPLRVLTDHEIFRRSRRVRRNRRFRGAV